MRNPPGYWAAVRLTAFANCEISAANWRTLWPVRRRGVFRSARRLREIAARRGFEPEDLQGAIWANIRLVPGRAPKKLDEMEARESVATLRAMKLPAADALATRFGRIEESPFRPWPRSDGAGCYLNGDALRTIQKKTRNRLKAVCAGEWQGLLRLLRRRRFSPERLVMIRHSQLGDVPILLPYPETSLELHLDRLFVETLVAGLWSRIYECEGCKSFGVRSRLGERARQLCTQSKCRVRRHRAKRKQDEEALRKKVRAAMRTCIEPDASDVVRKRFGLTAADMNRLLR